MFFFRNTSPSCTFWEYPFITRGCEVRFGPFSFSAKIGSARYRRQMRPCWMIMMPVAKATFWAGSAEPIRIGSIRAEAGHSPWIHQAVIIKGRLSPPELQFVPVQQCRAPNSCWFPPVTLGISGKDLIEVLMFDVDVGGGIVICGRAGESNIWRSRQNMGVHLVCCNVITHALPVVQGHCSRRSLTVLQMCVYTQCGWLHKKGICFACLCFMLTPLKWQMRIRFY